MKFEEAVECLLKGQKIRNIKWDEKDLAYHTLDMFASFCKRNDDFDDWEVLIETVPFYMAWDAYERGKTVKSVKTLRRFSKEEEGHVCYNAFNRDEVRGEWIIL